MYIRFITFPQPSQYQNQQFIVWIYCVKSNSFWENDRLDYKCILRIKTECSGAPRQQSDGNEPPWLRFEQRGDGRLGVQIPRVVQETGAAALPGHPRHDDAPPVLRAGGRHLLYCSNIQGLILWTTPVLDENNHINAGCLKLSWANKLCLVGRSDLLLFCSTWLGAPHPPSHHHPHHYHHHHHHVYHLHPNYHSCCSRFWRTLSAAAS